MVIQADNVEQRKRKRQPDSAYTLTHRSLYRADGTVKLKFYRELSQTDVSPENTLGLTEICAAGSIQCMSNKVQRNLVSPISPQHLSAVESLEEFKCIFLQLVHCHRVIHVKTGGVHGDLNSNNLVFTRDEREARLGLLNDWDVAKLVPADETHHMPSARQRTGTAPFVAIDLLCEDPPPHLYRHGLESFLYVLIWCALHFNLNGSEVSDVSELVADWTYGSWRSIQKSKAFLFSAGSLLKNEILDSITPAFLPISIWINGLIRMFRAGDQARITHEDSWESDAEDEAADAWDEDSLNGTVTYEKFMAAIGEEPHIAELDSGIGS